ncbi:hypothetical protein DES45_11624 [Microvirga subterranea]|uniref:Uncharacterized protein n=1 Tax=Microvirga subterranea TaxID=186651 RepID=A0A370HC68_9HYPH|nr:hypothetical protein DES45_11624 [Microvirga subterranea]
MTDAPGRQSRQDRRKDADLMFWYWLPLVGASFGILGWLSGS